MADYARHPMTKVTKSTALKEVQTTWTNIFGLLRNIDRSVLVRPQSPTDIFQVDDDYVDGIRVNISPVVFYVPYKASTSRTSNTFIVVSGQIDFCNEAEDRKLLTASFSTRVGYFLESGADLEHVYGAHYDFDAELIAHPVFHSQLSTHAQFLEEIKHRYQSKMKSVLSADYMEKVPGIYRIPTAQMDFFSVVLQICSDHMINSESRKKEVREYNRLIEYCKFIVGFGADHTGLKASRERSCSRSPYWYNQALTGGATNNPSTTNDDRST